MAYADKFPTSMKKGGMKKSLPKAQIGKIVKKAVKSAKNLKAAASEKMWPTKNLRRMEDWDAHYRQKAQDKFTIGVGAGLGAAGAAGIAADSKDKKKPIQKKVPVKKQFGGDPNSYVRSFDKNKGPVKKPSMLEEQRGNPISGRPAPDSGNPSSVRRMNVEENQRRALTTGDTSSGPMFKKTDPKDMFKSIDKMKKGGMKTKMKKGGFPDLTGDGKVTRADVLKGRGVFKKGGSIMKTAGKTTTGVVSDYKGYKGPKVKAQVAKVKKGK